MTASARCKTRRACRGQVARHPRLDAGIIEYFRNDTVGPRRQHLLTIFGGFHIGGRIVRGALPQPFIRDKEEEFVPHDGPAGAAGELAQQLIHAHRRRAIQSPEFVVRIKNWVVIFEDTAAVKLISAVLRYDFNLRAGVPPSSRSKKPVRL